MRTSLLLAAAVAFVAVPASAQATFGLKGGLNTAFFSGSDADGTEARLGGVGGAFVRYDATPNLALQVEALYSQEGAKEPEGVDEGTYKFDYVDIPILIRYAVPVSQFADAGVYAGPSIGIPIREEFEFADGETVAESINTDFGITVGADYWSGPIGVDLRYTAGLADVFNEELDDPGDEPLNIKNQALTVTLGFRFGGMIGR